MNAKNDTTSIVLALIIIAVILGVGTSATVLTSPIGNDDDAMDDDIAQRLEQSGGTIYFSSSLTSAYYHVPAGSKVSIDDGWVKIIPNNSDPISYIPIDSIIRIRA